MARRPVKSEYKLSDMAADAVGLLDALEVESAHVVGMSMGGMIAQTMAIEHAGRVRSLTSIMSNTGDRRHGKIARKLLSKIVRLPAPTRETAVERSVTTFRLVSGPHFDESEHRLIAKRDGGAQLPPAGRRPSDHGDHGRAPTGRPDCGASRCRRSWSTGSSTRWCARAVVSPRPERSPAPGSIMYPDMGHDLPRPRWADLTAEIRRTADLAT